MTNPSSSEEAGGFNFPMSFPLSVSSGANNPLKYEFVSGNYRDEGEYVIKKDGVSRTSGRSEKQSILPVAEYISSNVTAAPNFIAEQFGNIELAGKTPILVEALQLLDERIVDLKTIVSAGTGSIYATTSDNQRYPIRTMGDGINKLLRVLITML